MMDRGRFAAGAGLRRAGVVGRRIHWYYVAAICVVAVAAALRFYELGQPLAHLDEVAVSNNSGGTLAEVVHNTRVNNSAPLLYPLLLWAVQQIDISPFSIRLLPAAAGTLTVAVILLLPRFGVRREAALLAALLAALAPAAIYEARGAREYGIDALAAALLIAGLLWYRQGGRKELLCAALLTAPLLQYGLVLFGTAILAAGLLLPPIGQGGIAKTAPSLLEWIKNWLRRRIGLALPTAFFLAGCVISYLTTLRYQLEIAGTGFAFSNYYQNLYFSGEYQVVPVVEFAIASAWGMARHHLPLTVILVALGAVGICLAAAGARRLARARVRDRTPEQGGYKSERSIAKGHWDVIAVLLLLALAAAICAGLWGQYPAAATRHITYLGPAVFLFSGGGLAAAIYGLATAVGGPAGVMQRMGRWRLAALLNRERLAPALTIAVAVVLAGASIAAIGQNSPYRMGKAVAQFAILERSAQDNDIVYITNPFWRIMSFYGAHYGRDWPDNYIKGTRTGCERDYTGCIREVSNIVAARGSAVDDVWLVNDRKSLASKLARYDDGGSIDSSESFRQILRLSALNMVRFPAGGGLLDAVRREWQQEYRPALSGEAVWSGAFDIYYNDNRLTYDREGCAPADVAAQFFLHLFPAGSPSDLPARWQPYGFENRDFDFLVQDGALLENRCVVTVDLPDYDIASIHTGQYAGGHRLWQAGIPLPGAARYDMERVAEIAAGEPAARAVFNLHRDGYNLLYAKKPCAESDTDAPFFLHITPADPQDLPETQRDYGFDNRDFSFAPEGMRFDGGCYISRPLPQYEIAGIRTGQYTDAGRIWEAELAP